MIEFSKIEITLFFYFNFYYEKEKLFFINTLYKKRLFVTFGLVQLDFIFQ